MQHSFTLRRIATRLPAFRSLAHETPPYFVDSVLVNRLGLQIFRMLGHHLAWRLRNGNADAEIASYVRQLADDGVLLIPHFLSEQAFAQVRAEFDHVKSSLAFSPFREVSHGSLHVARLELADADTRFRCVREYLQHNSLMLRLVSAISRHPITVGPRVAINVYRQVDASAPDNDIENILHADLHLTTVKVWYYLNDIDESNGAFTYAKGSHKVTLSRLKHEYDISVRTARLRRGDTDIPERLLASRGSQKRNVVADRYLRAMKIHETPMCGKANSLLIANNMGFHRRGTFTRDRPREMILLNFRHLARGW